MEERAGERVEERRRGVVGARAQRAPADPIIRLSIRLATKEREGRKDRSAQKVVRRPEAFILEVSRQ